MKATISTRKALAIVLAAIVLTAVVTYVFAASSTIPFTISGGNYPGAPSYTIWREGSNYFAKNASGVVEFSGTNASQVIQNTIADNRKIFLKEGVYLLDGIIDLSGCSNVTLEGEGWGTILKLNTLRDKIILIGGNASDYSEGITIRNLAIDGNELSSEVYGENSRGILVGYCKNVLIDHVYIKGCSRYTMSVYNTPQGKEYTQYLPKFVTVQNCKFEAWSGAVAETLLFGGIFNNFINNEVDSDDLPNRICLTLYDNTYYRSKGILVEGNYIHTKNGTKWGIFVNNVMATIRNNRVEGFNHGIRVAPSGEQAVLEGELLPQISTIVEDNIVCNNGVGVVIVQSGTTIVERNIICNNSYEGILITPDYLYGIFPTRNISSVIIESNYIYNNGQSGSFGIGIHVQDDNLTDTVTINDLIILSNLIFDTQTTPTQTRSIRYENGTYSNHKIAFNILNNTTPIQFASGVTFLNSQFFKNKGFITENSGTATISASTSVTFDHGLAGTPTLVLCSFNSTGYGAWTWSATATQITITVTNSGTYEVYWYAEYKP